MGRPRKEQQNYVGQIIDHLEVIGGPVSTYASNRMRTYWNCRCVCGNELAIREDNLGTRTHSCGCRQHAVTDPADRFSKHIAEKSGGCWEWTGAKNKDGTGMFAITCNPITIVRADRASWFIKTGTLEDSKNLLHKCPNEWCINPDHMFTR